MLENIKAICKQKGLSILQLEQNAGLAANTVYRWKENMPSVDKVKRVADVLGVTVDELLREDNEHEC